MRLGRVLIASLAVVALAGMFSGCLVFKGQPVVKQIKKKPKVAVSFKICLSNPDPESTCPSVGNSGDVAAAGDWRALIGFRVPKGTDTPSTFKARSVDPDGGNGGVFRFERNNSYRSELNEKAPLSPNKFTYAGYSSHPFEIAEDAGFSSRATFKVRMGVPNNVVGKRFKVRPVLGSYQVSAAQPANDPIDCGPDPFEATPIVPNYDDGTYRICIDSPLESAFSNISVKIKD